MSSTLSRLEASSQTTLPHPAPRERAGIQLTLAGFLLMVVAMLVGLSAMFNQANLLFLIASMSFALVGVSAWVTRSSIDLVSVQRSIPSSVTAGQGFTITYRIKSTRTRGKSYSILIRDRLGTAGAIVSSPGAYVPVLSPGQEIELNVPAMARHRGMVRFEELVLETRFPFGLIRRYRRCACPGTLRVLPALLPVRNPALGKAGIPYEDARNAGRKTSSAGEFFGLRDYRQGDNPHWIHWRRSAKTGKLVVREMIEPQSAKLILVVDVAPPSHESTAQHDEMTEMLIRAAATIGCTALDAHASVGWVVLADTLLAAPPAIGLEQRHRLLSALAEARYRAGPWPDQRPTKINFSTEARAAIYIFTQLNDDTLASTWGSMESRARNATVIRPFDDLFNQLFVLDPMPGQHHAATLA